MRIILSIPLIFGLILGFGCEPEDETAMALDGSVELDLAADPDQAVSMDAEADAAPDVNDDEECD